MPEQGEQAPGWEARPGPETKRGGVKLELKRLFTDEDGTIGKLYADDVFQCHTLEDPVRPAGVKIPKETAIPAGTYKVVITQSPRFRRPMPLLIDVPNFEGVRIHSGNTTKQTEGCILVGKDLVKDSGKPFLSRSRVAYAELFAKLQMAAKRGAVTLVITEEFEKAKEQA